MHNDAYTPVKVMGYICIYIYIGAIMMIRDLNLGSYNLLSGAIQTELSGVSDRMV